MLLLLDIEIFNDSQDYSRSGRIHDMFALRMPFSKNGLSAVRALTGKGVAMGRALAPLTINCSSPDYSIEIMQLMIT